jgi:calcium-dependent protein kinase
MATETEEQEIYKVISEALLSLCEEKPNDPVDYLSRKMLELIGDDPNSVVRKLSEEDNNEKVNENIIITPEKIALNNLSKNFFEYYNIIKLIVDNVYLCEDIKLGGEEKCVRIIDKKKNPFFLSEGKIKMLVNLDSPNIIKIFNIFEDDDYIYVVHDYCPEKDIFSFIQKYKNNINEALLRNIIKQTLIGINYLHQKGILHKNINPSKILVYSHDFENNEIHIKISDIFTNAEYFSRENLTYKSFGNRIENPLYLAPEFLEQKYNNKVDIWSIGVICYILFTGKPPFVGKPQEIIYQIGHKNVNYPGKLNKIKKDFLKKMLNNNPNLRAEAFKLIKDEYFEVDIEELGVENKNENEENKNEEIAELVGIMNQIAKNSIKNNFKRSILTYIASHKIFDENNTKLRKAFSLLDVNKDGSVEIAELYKYYKKYFPGVGKEQYLKMKKFIEAADLNNNGKIEYSEFLTISSFIQNEFNDTLLKEIFDYYDYQKNGYIEANDFKELFEDTNISDHEIHQILDEVDRNGDRKINFEEFKYLMRNSEEKKTEENTNKNESEAYLKFVKDSAQIFLNRKDNENENENENENNENENKENENENNENENLEIIENNNDENNEENNYENFEVNENNLPKEEE